MLTVRKKPRTVLTDILCSKFSLNSFEFVSQFKNLHVLIDRIANR